MVLRTVMRTVGDVPVICEHMGVVMAKYLVRANYTVEGIKGVIREGGSGRRDAVGELAASLGGTLDAFYFGFGDTDAYVIVDLPSQEAAAAIALAVGAAGGASITTTVLLTPEQMDAARNLTPQYRAPGQ
jgi:uncharacterized protein with GYD domain